MQRSNNTRRKSILTGFKQVEKMEKELAQLNKLAGARKSGTNWETRQSIQNKKREIETRCPIDPITSPTS